MDLPSFLGMWVMALVVGQESRVVLSVGSVAELNLFCVGGDGGGGDGGGAGVAGARWSGMCAVILDGMARFLACSGTGRNSRKGFEVRAGAYAHPLETDTTGGLAAPTPLGLWPDHQWVCPPNK